MFVKWFLSALPSQVSTIHISSTVAEQKQQLALNRRVNLIPSNLD
jgi:hypothetical protein